MRTKSTLWNAWTIPISIQDIQENEPVDVLDQWDTETICKQIIPCSPCMIHLKLLGTEK